MRRPAPEEVGRIAETTGSLTKDGRSAIRQGFRRIFLGRRGPCSSARSAVLQRVRNDGSSVGVWAGP